MYLVIFFACNTLIHGPRSSQSASSGFSSLDKSTMKQGFVDTFVGGTDDIFL